MKGAVQIAGTVDQQQGFLTHFLAHFLARAGIVRQGAGVG
jgi:hypothetical protein